MALILKGAETDFVSAVDYSNRDEAKRCGFSWNPAFTWPESWLAMIDKAGDQLPGSRKPNGRFGAWVSAEPANAADLAALGHQLTTEARQALGNLAEQAVANAEQAADSYQRARALTPKGTLRPVHPADVKPFPFQVAGVERATEIWDSGQQVLLGDAMGLGKTIQALLLANLLWLAGKCRWIVIVCPNSVQRNWEREARKWLLPLACPDEESDDNFTEAWTIGTAKGNACPNVNVAIVPWSIIARHAQPLTHRGIDLLIVDEAHYAKNEQAKRSQAVYRMGAARTIYMTGTPIVNRPKELWPILRLCNPDTWGDKATFNRHYCAGHYQKVPVVDDQGETTIRMVYVSDGASNLDDLNRRLHTDGPEGVGVMIRRLKSEVLTDLPPKLRQVVEFEIDTPELEALLAEEAELAGPAVDVALANVNASDPADNPEGYAAAVAGLAEAIKVNFEAISRIRRLTAEAKAPAVVEHLLESLDSAEEGHKIVVWAHHHVMVDTIRAGLTAAGIGFVEISGRTPADQRQPAIDSFQEDSEIRVFLGSIMAAAEGITLTASAHVIFAELDWTPGKIEQAEDRCHRIGQNDSVFVQHLVLAGSLDARMANILVEKMSNIRQGLDTRPEIERLGERRVAEALEQEAAIRRQEAERLAAVAQRVNEAPAQADAPQERLRPDRRHELDPEAVADLIACWLILDHKDPDRAGERNDIGWSGQDTPTHSNFVESLLVQVRQDPTGDSLTDRQVAAMADVARRYLGPAGQIQRLDLMNPEAIERIQTLPSNRGNRRDRRPRRRQW